MVGLIDDTCHAANVGVQATSEGSGPGSCAAGDNAMGVVHAEPAEAASHAPVVAAEAPCELEDDDKDNDEGKASRDVTPTMLAALAKNRAGTWWSSQRTRNPLWSFFCPADHRLGWEERSKTDNIDSLIFYAQR